MSVDLLERPHTVDGDTDRGPQLRLSNDGLAWGSWHDLFLVGDDFYTIEGLIPDYGYAQVRVWTGSYWWLSSVFAEPSIEE